MRVPRLVVLDQRGISLIEVIAGTLISVLVIAGLAHSFGVGRGLINRYEIARVALSTAQERLELLSTLQAGSDSLAIPAGEASKIFPSSPFMSRGRQVGEVLAIGVHGEVAVGDGVRWGVEVPPDLVLSALRTVTA